MSPWCAAYTGADGLMVTDLRKIALRYSRSWLLIDLLSSIPTATTRGGSNRAVATTLLVLRLFKLFRLVRFWRYIESKEVSRAFVTGEGRRALRPFTGPIWRYIEGQGGEAIPYLSLLCPAEAYESICWQA
jgi:hypothetical protein